MYTQVNGSFWTDFSKGITFNGKEYNNEPIHSNPNPETHSYEIGVVWRQARLFADTLLFFPFRSQTSNSFYIGEIFVSLCVTFRYVLGMCMNVFYDWCCFGITNRVIVKCIAFLFTWFNVNRCLKSRTVHAEKTTRYFEIHSVKWYVYQNNNENLTINTKQIQIKTKNIPICETHGASKKGHCGKQLKIYSLEKLWNYESIRSVCFRLCQPELSLCWNENA